MLEPTYSNYRYLASQVGDESEDREPEEWHAMQLSHRAAIVESLYEQVQIEQERKRQAYVEGIEVQAKLATGQLVWGAF